MTALSAARSGGCSDRQVIARDCTWLPESNAATLVSRSWSQIVPTCRAPPRSSARDVPVTYPPCPPPDLGDHVRAGQVMVELDHEKLQYKLDSQRAALNRALAKFGATQPGDRLPSIDQTPDVKKAATQRAQSELAWKRAGQLADSKLISQEQLEAAQAKYTTDKAAYDSALQNAKDLR